jgi:aminoglycoside phosphotransferase (APT) family kinase protein
MSDPELHRQIAELVQRIYPQGRLLRTWQLDGGVSAQMTAFEFALPDGQTRKMIVRRHGGVDLEQNPNIAADEFKLLRILRSAGLAVPTPYLLDQSGEISATPTLVLEYIEGKPEFEPANVIDLIPPMAAQLAKIHRVRGANPDLFFLPRQEKGFGERPPNLDRSLEEGRIRGALESIWPLPQTNESVLLHGDFWPGNILPPCDRPSRSPTGAWTRSPKTRCEKDTDGSSHKRLRRCLPRDRCEAARQTSLEGDPIVAVAWAGDIGLKGTR